MAKLFSEYQPIYRIEDNVIFNRRGEYGIGIRLELPEIFTKDKHDIQKAVTLFESILRIMPEYTVLHKQDWFTTSNYKIDKKMMGSYFSRSFELAFNQRPFVKHECLIYLIKTTKNVKQRTTGSTLLSRPDLIPGDLKSDRSFNEFLGAVEGIITLLNGSGLFHAEKILDGAYFPNDNNTGILNRYATFSDEKELGDYYIDKELQLGGRKLKAISFSNLSLFPEKISYTNNDNDYRASLCFMHPVALGLKCNHVYNQYIFKDNITDTITEKEAIKNSLGSFSAVSATNRTNHKHLAEFLDVATGHQIPVRWHGNLIMWEEETTALTENVRKARAAMNRLGFLPYEETVDLGVLYFAGFPGNGADIPKDKTCTLLAKQACALLNYETNYISSKSDYGFKVCDRVNNAPVHIDITEEPFKNSIIHNRNKIIIGTSGSGKSALGNMIVDSELRMGNHVLVIDKGRSFFQSSQIYNSLHSSGVFIEFSEQNKVGFNPFYFDGYNDPTYEISKDKIENLVQIILALWLNQNDTATNNIIAQLEEYVYAYYATIRKNKKDIFPCFHSFYAFLKKVWEKLKNENSNRLKYLDFEDFFIVMKKYTLDGAEGYILNAKSNLDLLDKHYVVFETDAIAEKESILSTVVMMIISLYMDKIFKLDETIGKSIVMDEAWSALMNKKMSGFIKWAEKTVRKHNGSITVMSQELDDLLNNEIVKDAIVSNSPVKIIGDISDYKSKIGEVSAMLGLSEHQSESVSGLNMERSTNEKFREFLFKVGNEARVYRVIYSKQQLYGFSTNKNEQAALKSLKNKYGNYIDAIEAYAEKH